eukprot:7371948-Prymnesium_polylepis.3
MVLSRQLAVGGSHRLRAGIGADAERLVRVEHRSHLRQVVRVCEAHVLDEAALEPVPRDGSHNTVSASHASILHCEVELSSSR